MCCRHDRFLRRAIAARVVLFTFILVVIPSVARAQEKPVSGSSPGVAKQAEAPAARERLRYAGRSFDDWQDQLLNDLDAETCKKAMPPVAAFGKNGYAAEAVAALRRRLHDDREDVTQEAAKALAALGLGAVEALIEGLSDERPHVRLRSTDALGSLHAIGKPATKALLKRLDDKEKTVRLAAIPALANVAGDDEALKAAFGQFAGSDEFEVRNALAKALAANTSAGGWRLTLLLRLADDESPQIRIVAGSSLAHHGPPEKTVIDVFKRLLDDTEKNVWRSTIDALVSPGNGATKIPVLAAALTSSDDGAHLRKSGYVLRTIHALGTAREEAEIAVPVLIEVVEGKLPDTGPNEQLAAIDALGRLGPRAKRAVPVLEHWIFDEKAVGHGNGDLMQKHAQRALRRIAASVSDAAASE